MGLIKTTVLLGSGIYLGKEYMKGRQIAREQQMNGALLYGAKDSSGWTYVTPGQQQQYQVPLPQSQGFTKS
ncbi:hypothetical protein LTR70_002627 [Exophiala xenobiotica]|uniref:Uncharacterized protein n=1 Tax=Lithohypha guttulata TaxID=1690604 RepID=A0ABR0KIN1_9EURO|nr:hypothetical protein LTR24_002196 [Lithohypha guttulata]KAK5325247.1 hypothetical protein LTR70_002627 [Exophiala xenobiotica]